MTRIPLDDTMAPSHWQLSDQNCADKGDLQVEAVSESFFRTFCISRELLGSQRKRSIRVASDASVGGGVAETSRPAQQYCQ